MFKKLLIGGSAVALAVASVPLFAAFEAHVINVTAKIENALFVHQELLEYGTVFPQEHLDSQFFISFSQSFSASTQRRVGSVDYLVKQKPMCVDKDGNHPPVGEDAQGKFVCPPGSTMMPSLCPYLSKHPDNNPSTGPFANDDTSIPPFHDHNDPASYAKGKLAKFNASGSTIDNDPADTWTVDLAVPCFKGMCAQDWDAFVHSLNPAADPAKYMLDPSLEHQLFGCDLWVEVTKIYSESEPQITP